MGQKKSAILQKQESFAGALMNTAFPWLVATVLGLIAIWYQLVSWRLDKNVSQLNVRLRRQAESLAHAQHQADSVSRTLVIGRSQQS